MSASGEKVLAELQAAVARGEARDWVEAFALHIRNQTLDVVVKTLREGAQRWECEHIAALAVVLEDAKGTPADGWWQRQPAAPEDGAP